MGRLIASWAGRALEVGEISPLCSPLRTPLLARAEVTRTTIRLEKSLYILTLWMFSERKSAVLSVSDFLLSLEKKRL